ncbi:MAG: hypothetical protein LBE13_04490 [Bacteroidales bacterium]|jgi:Flp pilus assembly CpaF family ATPase|nr:hypothetical protein [Bacteroidales bacterium]
MNYNLIGWFLEKILKRDEIEEMTVLRKTDAGLPVNIILDDSRAYVRWRHPKSIKFQGDYEYTINRSNLFFMTISENNPEVPHRQLSKLQLPVKDLATIKAFVKSNARFLDKLADEEISNLGFFRQIGLMD